MCITEPWLWKSLWDCFILFNLGKKKKKIRSSMHWTHTEVSQTSGQQSSYTIFLILRCFFGGAFFVNKVREKLINVHRKNKWIAEGTRFSVPLKNSLISYIKFYSIKTKSDYVLATSLHTKMPPLSLELWRKQGQWKLNNVDCKLWSNEGANTYNMPFFCSKVCKMQTYLLPR